jgi:hypothetical protein
VVWCGRRSAGGENAVASYDDGDDDDDDGELLGAHRAQDV